MSVGFDVGPDVWTLVNRAWALVDKLNPHVPWSQEALDLQEVLVQFGRRPGVCEVCGEALAPGSPPVHARCRATYRSDG